MSGPSGFLKGDGHADEDFEKFDPAVLASARQAGVSDEHLRRLAALFEKPQGLRDFWRCSRQKHRECSVRK